MTDPTPLHRRREGDAAYLGTNAPLLTATEALAAERCALAAKVAHEVNRAWCESLGDDSQPEWDSAPEWQQRSAIAGVQAVLENPDITPAQLHQSWAAAKMVDGWRYGATKNPETKEHPCLLPYGQLPKDQRTKDALFRAVVTAILF